MGITPVSSTSPGPRTRRERERDRDARRDARDRFPSAEGEANIDRIIHDFNIRLQSVENNLRLTSQGVTEHTCALELLEKRFTSLEDTYAHFSAE